MISQTVGALITAACEELEVIPSGGTLTAAEQASAIDRLQRLIDSSAVKRPLIFGEALNPLTLSANTQSYTIGIDPTGAQTAAFNVAWPTKIERANLLLSATVRRPIEVIGPKRWAQIRYQQVYGPPREVYFDRNFPSNGGAASGFGTMYFYPIPDQAYSWEFYSWLQARVVTAITDLLNYPPGYADYWLYALIPRLASMFGTEPTQTHLMLLEEARAAIATENTPSPILAGAGDAAIGDDGGDGGLYSWLDGQIEP